MCVRPDGKAMGQPRHRRASERIFDHPFLSLRRDHFGDRAGTDEKAAYVIEIANWVNIVALDDLDRVLMVSQFRYGTGSVTLEIPGGAIDSDEVPLAAAERELMEETGFEADDWSEVGVVEPNPAIQGNRCTTFVARRLRRVREFDAEEIDDISFVPLADLRGQIRAGTVQHALVIAAIYFAIDAIEQAAAKRAAAGALSGGAGGSEGVGL